MNRGDIVLVDLPHPKISGREQVGTRPAVILQAEPKHRKLPTAVIVPLTSQKSALRFAATILIQPSSTNGLESESVAMGFQVRAIDKSRIKQVIGKLEQQYLVKLSFHVRRLLGL